jgi:hypothetical protein
VTLAPNAYLVIGAYVEEAGSLGHQALVSDDGASVKQRLLILRTSRPARNADSELEERASGDRAAGVPALAFQASRATAVSAKRKPG